MFRWLFGSKKEDQTSSSSETAQTASSATSTNKKRKRGEGTGFGGHMREDRNKLLKGRQEAAIKSCFHQANTLEYLKHVCYQSLSEQARGRIPCDDTLVEALKDIFCNPLPDAVLVEHAILCLRMIVTSGQMKYLGTYQEKSSLISVVLQFQEREDFMATHNSAEADSTNWTNDIDRILSMIPRRIKGRKSSTPLHQQSTGQSSADSELNKEESKTDEPSLTPRQQYADVLGPLRFQFVTELRHHSFSEKRRPKRMDIRKVFRELSGYSQNLPLDYASTIFVRSVEGRIDLVRALIVGPEGTPYENGLFFFDIFLDQYPKDPPQVQFLNTGSGRIQFNPHLHKDGKVCLSLLGTWLGPGWVTGESTLLQVLISLQSMILIDDPLSLGPLFSEMGFGRRMNNEYNALVRKWTLEYAMQPFLTCGDKSQVPYPEFAEAMEAHFRIKRDRILEQVASWKAADPSLQKTVSEVSKVLSDHY